MTGNDADFVVHIGISISDLCHIVGSHLNSKVLNSTYAFYKIGREIQNDYEQKSHGDAPNKICGLCRSFDSCMGKVEPADFI